MGRDKAEDSSQYFFVHRFPGFLAYLLSKPPHWRVRMTEWWEVKERGEKVVTSFAVVRELVTVKIRVEDGKLEGTMYEVYEEPRDGIPGAGKPGAGIPPPSKE